MMRTTFLLFIVITFICLLIVACQKELSCEDCNLANRPPVAVAGADQIIILPRDSVLLNGAGSTDPDGRVIRWQWTKVAGPASLNIRRTDSATTSVTRLAQGIYQFELRVTDDKGASATDTVQIQVDSSRSTNRPPVACAGADRRIVWPNNSLSLDGSCTVDPDNNIASYTWSKISGPLSFNIANAAMVQTQVSSLAQGVYLFQLKVADAGGLQAFDTVQILIDPNNTLPVDIYVSGHENSTAVFWKNGQKVNLPSTPFVNSAATSIAVVGNNVYVAGWEGDFHNQSQNRAKYWKNGQEVFLTGTTGAGANSIMVVGGDVYVAGWEVQGSHRVARYWKNGQAVTLTNGLTDAGATCIVVVAGDVYVSGYEDDVAKYWKNGQPVLITNQGDAYSIAVAGNDVHVTGFEMSGSAPVAKYWKNGQSLALTNGSATFATGASVAVAGNEVYVGGWEGDPTSMSGATGAVAKLWKNGEVVTLTDGSTFAYVTSVDVFGGDVYVCATEFNGPLVIARYWKNGAPAPFISTNGAYASDIDVVQR